MTHDMQDQLLQVISRLSAEHPEWMVHGLPKQASKDNDEVAQFWVGKSTRVWLALQKGVAPTNVIPQGVLAHQKMLEGAAPTSHLSDVRLLVMPGLEVQEPMMLSARVVITNFSPDVIAMGLNRIAQRVQGACA